MPYLYRCLDKDTNETIYIGSSIQAWLCNRVCNHRYKYLNKPSIFHQYMKDNKGWDGYRFEIIKEFDQITREALLYEEKKLIEEIKPICNRQSPIVSREEELQKNKERYYKNREDWNMIRNQRVFCPHCDKEVSRSYLNSHVKLFHSACSQS